MALVLLTCDVMGFDLPLGHVPYYQRLQRLSSYVPVSATTPCLRQRAKGGSHQIHYAVIDSFTTLRQRWHRSLGIMCNSEGSGDAAATSRDENDEPDQEGVSVLQSQDETPGYINADFEDTCNFL